MLNPQRHKCVRYNRSLGAETSVGHLYMQLQMRKYYEQIAFVFRRSSENNCASDE